MFSTGKRFWLAAIAWWLTWRLPFWKAQIDFYDSRQFHDRVAGGFWTGLQSRDAHLPFQSTVYAPAGLLHALSGVEPAACITAIATVYGLLAFVAAIHLWRRFFSTEIVLWSVALYPMLAGLALADVTTYSMSALHAFLFGGTAVLARALERESRRDALVAAVLFGLAAYTHILAVIWGSLPAVVVIWHARKRTFVVRWAVLPSVVMVAAFLLLEGWQAALVGKVGSAVEGVAALIGRDGSLLDKTYNASLRHMAIVTTGPGIFMLLWGAWLWCRREGRAAVAGCVLVGASFVLAALQYHWGFLGRLYLPMLLWAIPVMLLPVEKRVGRIAVAALFVQAAVTHVFVLGSRKWGPHPGVVELEHSRVIEAAGDHHVITPDHRGFTFVRDEHVGVFWGEREVPSVVEHTRRAWREGHRVFVSSQAYNARFLWRDGHLVSVAHASHPRKPTLFESMLLTQRWVPVLDEPLGRGEFLMELVEKAPSLEERLARARRHVGEDWSVLVVKDASGWVRVESDRWLDCVNREVYDAFDALAFVSVLRTGCRPIATGALDVTGMLVKPVPSRDAYSVTLHDVDGVRVLRRWGGGERVVTTWEELRARLDEETFAAVIGFSTEGVTLTKLVPLR